MDVASGVGFRQSPCFATKDVLHQSQSMATGKPGLVCLKQRPNRRFSVAVCDGFVDKSHLEYYNNGPKMAVKEKDVKKEMKKKLKVLKGLSKNLSTFSELGFCLNVDSGLLDQQVKGQMISEATDVLLSQLQKLKAEKMESKRLKKEEKAKKKAARMTECKDSSSSSSSSSESDCENVVNMKQLKTIPTSISHQETASTLAVSPVQVNEVEHQGALQTVYKDVSNVNIDSNKIEVCMGGKCKKSGAAMLLENFQKAVGGEAAVVGCKCMGKCRDGPNVRVRNNNEDAGANPLCIGVGLEDVDSIVTNFFGASQRSCSDMVPAL
uniref:diacylglycerol O-acyltransferase 3 n=1 Tax=Erigeron canadensis TaxID=72917 RepID=UPI001CB93E22|nr:diacylglycerol O-acyltransferase 3 [Erigeron canadensis]